MPKAALRKMPLPSVSPGTLKEGEIHFNDCLAYLEVDQHIGFFSRGLNDQANPFCFRVSDKS